MAQSVAGQLSNVILNEDESTLMRNILAQVVIAMRDAVSLPWQIDWSAWTVSMTEVEKSQLDWAASIQWLLNRLSNSQLKVFNEGPCTSEGDHGSFKNFCVHCYYRGCSFSHLVQLCKFSGAEDTSIQLALCLPHLCPSGTWVGADLEQQKINN